MKIQIRFSTLLLSFIAVTCLCLWSACKNDDDDSDSNDPQPYELIDVVTGINLTDDNGQPLGRWQFPNDQRGEAIAFPNPFIDQVLVGTSSSNVEKYWIVPAGCDLEDASGDILDAADDLSFTVTEIEDAASINNTLSTPANQFIIDFSSINSGFYRLFLEVEDGNIYFINLYRAEEGTDLNQVVSNLDSICN